MMARNRLGLDWRVSSSWADRWWPGGDRGEIGHQRPGMGRAGQDDHQARRLCTHDRLRACGGASPVTGSLAAYREGRALEPVPGASVNLGPRCVDALRAAGEEVGATTAFCGLQSEVVPELLQAESHPDPLVDLDRRSHHSALSSEYVWGSHWWLLQC